MNLCKNGLHERTEQNLLFRKNGYTTCKLCAYDANKKSKIKYRYNLDDSQYKELCIEANGICKICNKNKKLYIDHDHITGEVRGLLCSKCNFLLGMAEDDMDILFNASNYIKLWHDHLIGGSYD